MIKDHIDNFVLKSITSDISSQQRQDQLKSIINNIKDNQSNSSHARDGETFKSSMLSNMEFGDMQSNPMFKANEQPFFR